jgi:hypothetical protein
MSQSRSSKHDAICPACGRELYARNVPADTRASISKRYAARAAALAAGPPTLEEVVAVIARTAAAAQALVALTRASMVEGDTTPANRKKLH